MNALMGERLSIITNKPQTTRHRIIGLLSDDNFQIVFSDTPGTINDPGYRMQEEMNRFAFSTLIDADVLLFMTGADEEYTEDDPVLQRVKTLEVPVFHVLNKVDLLNPEQLAAKRAEWDNLLTGYNRFEISALHKTNLEGLLGTIISHLPESPPYYPKDQLSDRPERFFIGEIIREKILEQYHQEIPYSAEVEVHYFKERTTSKGEPIIDIGANIYVARKTQKSIIIGKGGSAIRALGTEARKSISVFLESKIFLELFVKVKENWRDDEGELRKFGYRQ